MRPRQRSWKSWIVERDAAAARQRKANGMVGRLRAVTRARRRIWDAQARVWDMRFPFEQDNRKQVAALEPVGGVAAHLRGIQDELAERNRVYEEEQARERAEQLRQEHYFQQLLAYHDGHQVVAGRGGGDGNAPATPPPASPSPAPSSPSSSQSSSPASSSPAFSSSSSSFAASAAVPRPASSPHTAAAALGSSRPHPRRPHPHHHPRHHRHHSSPPRVDEQEALLDPLPTATDLELPVALLRATVVLQALFRGRLARARVDAALTYDQLLRRARLRRLAAHRADADARAAARRKTGRGLAKLQAMLRGYRGRRRAAYVRHRTRSAAALVVQRRFARGLLARAWARQARAATLWEHMSQRMLRVNTIQVWYRTHRARRIAVRVADAKRYARTRAEVIERMSRLYGAHICSVARWHTVLELRRRAAAAQFDRKYAVMVQAVIRAWGAKKAVRKLRTQRARRERLLYVSARKIQAMVRGYFGRDEVVRRAYAVVQEAARRRWVVRSNATGRDDLAEAVAGEDDLLGEDRYLVVDTPDNRGDDVFAAMGLEGEEEGLTGQAVEWYHGPEFNAEELSSDSGGESPRYW